MFRYVIQHVTAPSDRNGNPRRLYLVTPTNGESVTAYAEGYHGEFAVPADVRREGFRGVPVRVTAGEYRRLLKVYGGQA